MADGATPESEVANELMRPRLKLPIGSGWVVVVVASLAMTATLPGRTHGLGLITEPLTADLGIAPAPFARINLATCLLGTAFCLPIGLLLDRYGVRATMTGVVAVLGLSVIGMSAVSGAASLFLALLFVRGIGQSALSVVSMAAVGKWFHKRLGVAMGAYSVLLTFGFVGSILWVGHAVLAHGWRTAWLQLGAVLLAGLAPLTWFAWPSNRPGDSAVADGVAPEERTTASVRTDGDLTFARAMRTPAFWIFAIGAAAFNFVWSAVTLFNESILAERGFNARAAVSVMAILAGTGLIANLIGGALANRERIGRLLGTGLAVLTESLALFPRVTTMGHLWLYAAAIGAAGGLITVVFFTAWGAVFGRSHLGRIQGAAQIITVVASAAGPEFLAEGRAVCGSYAPLFYAMALVTGGLASAAFFVGLPGASAASPIESREAAAHSTAPIPQES